MALAAEGAHVVLTARTAGALEEVEEAIYAAGGTATIAPLDLTETDSIARLATAVGRALGGARHPGAQRRDARLAVGGAGDRPEEFAKVLTLNVSAQAALIAAFDPMLRKSAHARVIGLTSSVGRTPRAYWGAYGASKAAFETLVLAYGEEVEAVSKIRVAIVDPGATRTKMRERAYPGEDPRQGQAARGRRGADRRADRRGFRNGAFRAGRLSIFVLAMQDFGCHAGMPDGAAL